MRNKTFSDMVREFSTAMGGDQPYVCNDKYEQMKMSLVVEEFNEVMDAWDNETEYKPDQAQVLKELCDLVYVIIGYANYRGWDFETAFHRVHTSNMSKLGDDGKPVLREDGKVMKSNNYKPADLKDLV
jgi:predicted HAD superfamily Cof-like phosphohydrolase